MNPNWSRTYAGQEEILDYMDNLAAHYGLTDKIEFGRKAVKSVWNPVTCRWHVELDDGEVCHEFIFALRNSRKGPSYQLKRYASVLYQQWIPLGMPLIPTKRG